MLVQTPMLLSTRHIFCSEVRFESDQLQCCPAVPLQRERGARGVVFDAVNVSAGGWRFRTPGLPAAVPQELRQPVRGCVRGLRDGVHGAAHRPQRGLPVPGVRPRGRAAGVEPLERPPERPHLAGAPRYCQPFLLGCLCLHGAAGGVPAFGEDVTCNSFLVSLAEGRSENLSQVLTASLALESTWGRRKALLFLLSHHNISIFNDLQLVTSSYLGERKT